MIDVIGWVFCKLGRHDWEVDDLLEAHHTVNVDGEEVDIKLLHGIAWKCRRDACSEQKKLPDYFQKIEAKNEDGVVLDSRSRD